MIINMRIVTPAKQAITIPTIAPVLNPASSTTESEKSLPSQVLLRRIEIHSRLEFDVICHL